MTLGMLSKWKASTHRCRRPRIDARGFVVAERKGIHVLDVSLADGEQAALDDCRLAQPRPGRLAAFRLPVTGWVRGREARPVAVEVVGGAGWVGRSAVDPEERPRAGNTRGRVEAKAPGFEFKVAARGVGESTLVLRAVLEDERRIPMA